MEILRSEDRGYFDHHWLKTYHTFSFADYYNPKRMRFGTIRVFNDDVVDPHMGFGTHPHENMEIISIPLYGALEHKDSTGTSGIIASDEVQVMSAGTGVFHSEMNPGEVPVNFLQIWILPDRKDVKPRYDQKEFRSENRENIQQLLVSPDGRDGSLWIYQKAYMSRLLLTEKKEFEYSWFGSQNGVLIFLIKGRVEIDKLVLNERDTLLISNSSTLKICSFSGDAEILFIEIPMGL